MTTDAARLVALVGSTEGGGGLEHLVSAGQQFVSRSRSVLDAAWRLNRLFNFERGGALKEGSRPCANMGVV